MREDYEALLDRAHAAASAALRERYDRGFREQPFNCGFAWVTIRGTTGLARHCRAALGARPQDLDRRAWARYGDRSSRGHQWWKPGEWPRIAGVPSYQQDMDFHRAAAGAFAAVLREAGVEAWVETRLD